MGKATFAVVGLAILAALAAWQFYLFAVFNNKKVADLQGGTFHLWVAIGLALVVCVAGFFLFSKFLRYDKSDEIHITAQGHASGRK